VGGQAASVTFSYDNHSLKISVRTPNVVRVKVVGFIPVLKREDFSSNFRN